MKLSMKICLVLAAVGSFPCAISAPARNGKKHSKWDKSTKKGGKKSKNGKKDKYGLDKQTELVVFGDSLSDVGNVNQFPPCSLTPVIPDLYCGPRASNGPLAIDLFNEALGFPPLVANAMPGPDGTGGSPFPGGGNNFAFAAATASKSTSQNDFFSQVGLYTGFLQNSQGTATPSISATTLLYIAIGGNDVIRSILTDNPVAFVTEAVAEYIKNVEALVELGACSILVGGPADIGKIPVAFDFRMAASELSILFNNLLKAALEGVTIKNDDDSCYGIIFFDFFAITNEVLDDKRFQKEFPDPEAKCNDRFVVDCTQCNDVLTQLSAPPVPVTPSGICNCDVPVLPKDEIDFVCEGIPFYDAYHPTTRFNEFSTEFFLEFLEESARAE